MATKTTKAISVNVKPIVLHNAITEKLCLELLLLVTQELSSQTSLLLMLDVHRNLAVGSDCSYLDGHNEFWYYLFLTDSVLIF